MLVRSLCLEEGGRKPFRFFNIWTDHPDYKSIVENIWCLKVWGSGFQNIIRNLLKLLFVLKCFNKNFQDVENTYMLASHKVASIQSILHNNPNDHSLFLKEKCALAAFDKASIAYEKFLQQKSKVTWLKLGGIVLGIFMLLLRVEVLRIVFCPTMIMVSALMILTRLRLISFTILNLSWARPTLPLGAWIINSLFRDKC